MLSSPLIFSIILWYVSFLHFIEEDTETQGDEKNNLKSQSYETVELNQ